jgi:hypothetical protein
MTHSVEIIITDMDGRKSISKFSVNKSNHITKTNQWDYVMKTILATFNK